MSAKIPRHIAVIMDGNGRWARRHNKTIQEGHLAGFKNIHPVVQTLYEVGVKFLTLYAFSTENWVRPSKEVNYILGLFNQFTEKELDEYYKAGVRLLHIGHTDRLSDPTKKKIKDAVELTRNNTKFTLCVAVDYGGRSEIVHVIRELLGKKIPASDITEKLLSQYMLTRDLPDPDLVIRTSGEHRISNFLIWQAAYSEYYTSPTLWPDFGKNDIDTALEEYANRQRRFGKRN